MLWCPYPAMSEAKKSPESKAGHAAERAPENANPSPGRHLFTAEEADAGQRVDRLIAVRVPGLTRSRAKTLIESGALSLGGGTINEPSMRVKPGQIFAIEIPEVKQARPEGQAIDLAIVHEDDDTIVIEKPAGLVVHPAPGNPDRTLVNALIAHCGPTLSGIGGERRPGIVHRLDKNTSGLMIAAKSERALQSLTRQFAARSIERSYYALVWGTPVPPAGEISGNIGRSPRNRKKMAVVTRGGKPALTRYRLLRSFAGGAVSLIECRLQTGRTHQIRVHLCQQGHPLLGDPVYGRARPALAKQLPAAAQARLAELHRQALHAKTLGFQHPASGDTLRFESQLPDDLKGLIDCLESL
jgi:23S rRNA pseudouridine1911/1915/1917 synthase